MANTRMILPPPPRAAGSYAIGVEAGALLFLSGFAPREPDEQPIRGVVGIDFDTDRANELAQSVGLIMLSAIADILGDLDRVVHMVKITGMINAPSTFEDHPRVLDGCSVVLERFLGERGSHARAVFGVNSLPFGAPLSIDAVCRIR